MIFWANETLMFLPSKKQSIYIWMVSFPQMPYTFRVEFLSPHSTMTFSGRSARSPRNFETPGPLVPEGMDIMDSSDLAEESLESNFYKGHRSVRNVVKYHSHTLLETNSEFTHLKMDGWKTFSFPFGAWPPGRCELLVSHGIVTQKGSIKSPANKKAFYWGPIFVDTVDGGNLVPPSLYEILWFPRDILNVNWLVGFTNHQQFCIFLPVLESIESLFLWLFLVPIKGGR